MDSDQQRRDQIINDFAFKIRHGKIQSSLKIAKATAQMLRQVVDSSNYINASNLMAMIKCIGKKLVSQLPNDVVVGNIIRRVLHIIREESSTAEEPPAPENPNISLPRRFPGSLQHSPSLRSLLEPVQASIDSSSADIKSPILSQIDEYLDEIDRFYEPIAEQAQEHIYEGEVILTYGSSKSVERFFAHAKKKGRNFEVIVVENAPSFSGHRIAAKLSALGIPTTVVTDAACFVLMSRVNKVIVGTAAVLANGGLLCDSGLRLVAECAQHYRVPIVALAGLYKLCPLYPSVHDSFNDVLCPSQFAPYEIGGEFPHATVINPKYDYVPPELVSLFITNSGGHGPTYIYRLLAEYYSPEDYTL
eukprot:gnl/Trimastix_PCT/2126.p1 GENE.gnl/Trimastix_PCT/2126~~gnl/Trimastix_PCT/2126.p1  ORF type:complete len:361 (-),score=59.10 gnl/Trimastix_PCT/2126:76-1158(-)